MFRSTRSHLLLLLLLVSLPGIVVIYFEADKNRTAAIDNAEQKAVEIARYLAFTQKQIIDKTKLYLRYLATTSPVQNSSSSECKSFLQSILKLNSTFINIGVPKSNGELLCNALPLPRKINVFDRAYFQHSLTKRSFAIGTFQFDRAAQRTSLNFSYPVISRSDNTVSGIVVAVVSLDWWSKQLSEFGLPEGSTAFISDTKKIVVASFPVDTEKHGNPVNSYGLSLPNLKDNKLSKEFVAGEDGRNRIFIHHILYEKRDGQNVTVSVGIPIDPALNEANNHFILTLTIFTVFMVIVTLIASKVLNKNIIRPIEKLTMAVGTLEKGGLPERFETGASQEILVLKEQFENMAAKRLETERSAVSRTEELNAVFDALPDLFFKLNAEGVIIDYKASESLPLYSSSDQFLGKNIIDVIAEDSGNIFQDKFKEHLESKKLTTWEYPLEVNGIPMYFEARATSIRNSDEIIIVIRDITEQKKANDLIWHRGRYDLLTKLPNRVLFLELLDQAIKSSDRNKQQIWLLFMDLDEFKVVNDSFGHQVGDQLLVAAGARIQEIIRRADTVARLGGDEFVVTFTSNKQSDIDKLAGKLVEALAEKFSIEGKDIYISSSIGIANYPNDAQNADDLLIFSDLSMYVSKQGGKNRFSYFTPALQQASERRAEIASDLRLAINNDEFFLHYQPIVHLATGKVNKAEALIRWQHSSKGMVDTQSFINVAEGIGFINDIGALVFKTAFVQLESWKKLIDRDFQMGINMSPSQFKVTDEKYDDWLKSMGEHGLKGKNIVIEITEELLLNRDSLIDKKMLRYRDLGIQVAIDDFGTGYSSLAYLKEFDIDYLKIDRSFVNGLLSGSTEESICEAIIVMAHKLGLEVVAEGIETQEQLDLLKNMGCDFGQGFHISRPISSEDFLNKYG